MRRPDRSFRIGGDEFAILLPHTDAEGAWVVARRLLVSASSRMLRELGNEAISFSAGVSAMPELAASREQLYLQADTALYEAKRAGRTEVVRYAPGAGSEAPTLPAEQLANDRRRDQTAPAASGLSAGRRSGERDHARATRASSGLPRASRSPGLAISSAPPTDGHTVDLDLACLDVLIGGARRPAGRLLPERQRLGTDRRGAGVRHRDGAVDPSAPRLPRRPPRHRADRQLAARPRRGASRSSRPSGAMASVSPPTTSEPESRPPGARGPAPIRRRSRST